MPWVVIRPARIGDREREPGYVLSNDDLRGRDARLMEEVERTVRWVDDDPGQSPRRSSGSRSRKPADDE